MSWFKTLGRSKFYKEFYKNYKEKNPKATSKDIEKAYTELKKKVATPVYEILKAFREILEQKKEGWGKFSEKKMQILMPASGVMTVDILNDPVLQKEQEYLDWWQYCFDKLTELTELFKESNYKKFSETHNDKGYEYCNNVWNCMKNLKNLLLQSKAVSGNVWYCGYQLEKFTVKIRKTDSFVNVIVSEGPEKDCITGEISKIAEIFKTGMPMIC